MGRAGGDITSQGGRWPGRLALGLVLGLVLAAMGLGLALAALSWLPYAAWRGWADGLAFHGHAEVFTPGLHARLTLSLRVAGAALLAVGVLAALVRRRLASLLAGLAAGLGELGRQALAAARAALAGDGRAHLAALIGVLAVAAAARLWFVNLPLRYDEATTFMEYASRPLVVGLSYYSAPNNHLFHTLLVALSTRLFGDHEAAIRLPALLAGWLAVPALYALFRLLYDRRAGLLAAALAAGCPVLIEFSVNARGYGLVTLFFLLLLILLTWMRSHPNPAGMVLFSLLAALGLWSVPTMAYALAAAAGWWLLSSSPDGWWAGRTGPLLAGLAGAAGLTLLLYTPVILGTGWRSLLSAAGQAQPPPMADLAWAYARDAWGLCRRHWPASLAWALAGLAVLGALGHRRQGGQGLWWGWAALAGGLVVHLVVRSLPYPRAWLYLTPLALGAAGVGLAWLLRRQAEAAVSALALVLAAGLGLTAALSPAIPASEDGASLRDAAAIAARLAEDWREGDAVLTACPADEPLAYQFRRRGLPARAAFALLTGELASARRIWVVCRPWPGLNLADLMRQAKGQIGGCGAPVEVAAFPEAALHLMVRP